MKCLDCGAEMEQGTAECVGAGFESWYEFTSYNKVTVQGAAASRVFFHLKAEAVRMGE